jgi:hypothetical protein
MGPGNIFWKVTQFATLRKKGLHILQICQSGEGNLCNHFSLAMQIWWNKCLSLWILLAIFRGDNRKLWQPLFKVAFKIGDK